MQANANKESKNQNQEQKHKVSGQSDTHVAPYSPNKSCASAGCAGLSGTREVSRYGFESSGWVAHLESIEMDHLNLVSFFTQASAFV